MFEIEKYGKFTSQRVINEFSIVIQPNQTKTTITFQFGMSRHHEINSMLS